MKVPGIEEMIETGEAAFSSGQFVTLPREEMRRFLLAVFETHVKGMLKEAYLEGARLSPARIPAPNACADRILSQLKEPRHD